MGKSRHAKYKRPGHGPANLAAPERFRLVITFPGQTRTRRFSTSDLAQARSIARRNAATGAHVDLQNHEGWGRYTTTHTYTPEPRP